jgi:hypothetical protein
MTTLLSQDAFHDSVGHAFDELLAVEQMSRLPAESVLRVLQTIPHPLLLQALALTQTAARPQPKPRRKMLRGARVIQNGVYILEIQVRELGEDGCRVWTRRPEDVPERFTLRIVGIEGVKNCEVRRRFGEELELRFLSR